MALGAFNRELGSSQGRIVPTGWVAPEGSYAFVLGSDRPGNVVELAAGDGVKVTQTADSGGAALIRARLRSRAPAAPPPAGAVWIGEFRVNGIVVATIDMSATRTVADLAANVSSLGGTYPLEFQLRIAGVGLPAEVELPGLYVDAIVLDPTASRPIVANRFPAPGDSDVPRAATIQLDLMDITAAGISLAATSVYVDGVLAFAAGTFQAGWSGAGSQTSSLDSGRTRRIVIDPQNDFLSEQTVQVRVVSATTDGVPVDETYSFLVEDLTPPIVESAQAVDEDRVRVTFNEAVLQESGSGASDSLNPSNWSIEPVGDRPAVWAVVTGVTAVSPTVVEVRTDIPLTAGASYRAAATSVVDVNGNAIVSPFNVGAFVGFGDQVPGRSFDISDLLPDANLEQDETGDLQRFLWIIQEVTDLLLRRVDRWSEICDIDLAPEHFIDAILQDLGNPFPFTLTLLEKRKLSRLLVPIYRSKGLARGIKNAIRVFLGLEVTLRYPHFTGLRLGVARLGGAGPTPGTFVLGGSARDAYSYEIVSPRALTDEERDRIRAIATYMQVAHEHLVRIVEPSPATPTPNHVVLGLSRLGQNWRLH